MLSFNEGSDAVAPHNLKKKKQLVAKLPSIAWDCSAEDTQDSVIDVDEPRRPTLHRRQCLCSLQLRGINPALF